MKKFSMAILRKIWFCIVFAALFIWQLPQILVALVMMPFMGKMELISFKKFCYAFKCEHMRGGISLGLFAFVSPTLSRDAAGVMHEQEGHTEDSKRFGPLYLLIIGLPSLIWAGCRNREKHPCYYTFYTERWANKHAGLVVKYSNSGRCSLSIANG